MKTKIIKRESNVIYVDFRSVVAKNREVISKKQVIKRNLIYWFRAYLNAKVSF